MYFTYTYMHRNHHMDLVPDLHPVIVISLQLGVFPFSFFLPVIFVMQ